MVLATLSAQNDNVCQMNINQGILLHGGGNKMCFPVCQNFTEASPVKAAIYRYITVIGNNTTKMRDMAVQNNLLTNFHG